MALRTWFSLRALLVAYFILPFSLFNGQHQLANLQFEAAKKAFNQQDYFLTLRLAAFARQNSPGSAAPWLLMGHCFYLQGQDQAALYHYATALRLDPHIGPLPPFLESLRQSEPARGLLALSPPDLAALREKIGQMIMVSIPGTKLTGQKQKMLNQGYIGGVILFDQNVRSKRQIARYVRQLQGNSPTPLFVAVDQEGGAVRRFRESEGFQRLPSLEALGRTRSTRLAYRFGLLSGEELREAGANLNLAPVVDIDRGAPDSVISKYRRSLGTDPQAVSAMALEIVRGMRAKNVLAAAKHFPSETAAAANPHETVAFADAPKSQLEARDLVPYRALIRHGLLDAVMLSHVVYTRLDPSFPASLSPVLIQDMLRGELGFQGLVISDDLRMDAVKQRYPLEVSVVQAVNAGVDVLLVTDNYEKRVMDALVQAVVMGKVSPAKINDAFNRIIATKVKYRILPSVKAEKMLARLTPQQAPRLAAPASPASAPLQLARKP